MRRLYGHTSAAEFGPAGLRVIQKFMADDMAAPKGMAGNADGCGDGTEPKTEARAAPPWRKYCHKTINDYTARIRQLFK